MPSTLPFSTLSRRRLVQGVLAVLTLVALSAVQPARAAVPLDQAMASVFTVHSADAEDRFLGSAFLWADGAVAVTNAHVVGNAAEVRLTNAAGAQEIGRVIARDPVRDVAVISVQPGRRGLMPAPAPALGAEVWALGAPLGIEFTVTSGMISALARQVETAVPIRMLQHDAAVNPGSSGGPLVDAAGRLVGMNSQIADGSRMYVGIAYAITADDLQRIVTGLVEETLLPFPQLGIIARPVDRRLAQALGIRPGGLLVDEVDPAGLAARALLAGDVVLAVDGAPLTAPGGLAFAIEAALPHGAADVAVLRAGQPVLVLLDLVPADPALTLRDLSGAAPVRVSRYTMQTLGLVLSAGAVVQSVTEQSPAVMAGVVAGDTILALNGQTLDLAALAAVQITGPALLLLQGADGRTRHVVIDPWAKQSGLRPVGGANVLDPAVVVF